MRTGGFAIALLLAGAWCAQAQPDAFGYQASNQVAYSYLNIAGTGTAVLAGTDDGNATVNIGFPFRFYGTSYSSVCVSTNGLLSFGGCPAGDMTNLDLTSQAPAGDKPLIAPFWDDLTFSFPGAGAIVYQTMGTAGSRQFIVQWNNVYGLNAPAAMNFQVVLKEKGNVILFQYQGVEAGSSGVSRGASATVGIRDTSGQTTKNRLQWSCNSPVLRNSTAIQFTPPAGPTDVSAKVKVTTSAFVLNRTTQVYSGTVTITATATVAYPLTIVLTQLTPGVTAVKPTGLTEGPYYTVPPGSGSLTAGKSATVAVQFSNPSNARIGFVVKTYSGPF